MELLELVEYEPVTRPFQCDWDSCNKSFNRKSDLQRHYRIHTNKRPYFCTILDCGKSFIQRSDLAVHIRTHTDEKPHQCQHMGCGMRFSDSSSFARHCRIHTGKRPYKSTHDGCTKSFCRKTTMVKHERRTHQRGLQLNETLDKCSFDSDMGKAPPAPTQTAMFRPVSAVIPGHPMPHDNHVMHRAASFPAFNQYIHKYDLQNETCLDVPDKGCGSAPEVTPCPTPHPSRLTLTAVPRPTTSGATDDQDESRLWRHFPVPVFFERARETPPEQVLLNVLSAESRQLCPLGLQHL